MADLGAVALRGSLRSHLRVTDQRADDMQALHFLFSPSGRLRPQLFVWAVIVIYIAGLAAQWLTAPYVLKRIGIAPFAIAQILLIWMWFALHAKRLRDGGRRIGLAVGASVLYALGIVLLLVLGAGFIDLGPGGDWGPAGSTALGLIVLLSVIGILLHTANYDLIWPVVAGFLTVMALLPPIVALAVTVWAATRPSVAEHKT
jgi:uncharacterized membrane protein YhaH (DUF805 family)